MAKYGLSVRDELAAKIFVAFVTDEKVRQRAHDKAEREAAGASHEDRRKLARQGIANLSLEYADSFFEQVGKAEK